MNRFAILILLFASCATPWLAAQQSGAAIDRPAEPNFVFDDDGGKVQTVPKEEPTVASPAPKKLHGGAIMKSVQQVSIFLGSRWAEGGVRAREAGLSDLLANNSSSSNSSALNDLQSYQIKAFRAAPSVDDFSVLSTVNDLAIQHKLVELLANKAIPAPNDSTVYVVYLAPGVNSTIGGSKGGVDYLAYHNIVHVEAGALRYVVVPFSTDAATHRAAAARAYADTAENPNGVDGLY